MLFYVQKSFTVACREDLLFELPGKYLNKEIEAIAFQVSDDEYQIKKKKTQKAVNFLNRLR